MRTELTRFRVEDLHGRRTIDVPISENRLIIVGENGTGKSTVANLIYFVLTRQWARLREYRFSSIEIELGGQQIRITPEQIDVFRKHHTRTAGQFPASVRRAFMRYAEEHQLEEMMDNPDILTHFAHEFGVTSRAARELLSHYIDEQSRSSPELKGIAQQLADLVGDQVLYLPTYRRIEQDLKSILRGVDMEAQLRQFRERLSVTRSQASYVELVEFGMEDVEKALQQRMVQIKESVRNGLNNLTGTYLSDVIRGEHNKVSSEDLGRIQPETLEVVFDRIDEAVLPASDKQRLRSRVAAMMSRGSIDSEDKVIAHFLSKLLTLYQVQRQSEHDVRSFVEVCNGYLVGKGLVYDDRNFTIQIRQDDDRGSILDQSTSQEQLELRMLSSGEKQIVSLFSHIYLSSDTSFFVVIDEPELSLSVPWQRRFLPDILRTNRCNGLLAVTHSPFVWDNELAPYVRTLAEFTEPRNVLH